MVLFINCFPNPANMVINLRETNIFSFPNWGWFDLSTHSNLTCRMSAYLVATLSLSTGNEIVLMSLDRFLAVAYRGYQENLMRSLRYPVICTIINYTLTAIFSLPLISYKEISFAGVCIANDLADDQLGRFYALWGVIFAFTILPFACLLFFNAYTLLRIG